MVSSIIESRAMRSQATVAINKFHDLLNKGELDAACENEWFRKEPPNDCASHLGSTRRQFGLFLKTKKIEFQVIGEPQLVRAKTASTFENGELTEIFVMYPVSDRNLVVRMYQAVPPVSSQPPGSYGGGFEAAGGVLAEVFASAFVEGFATVKYLRIFSRRFGPMPLIARKSSTLLNAQYDLRIFSILSAVAGPIPGTS